MASIILSTIKYNNTQIIKPVKKRENILLFVFGPFKAFIERIKPITDRITAIRIRIPIIDDII